MIYSSNIFSHFLTCIEWKKGPHKTIFHIYDLSQSILPKLASRASTSYHDSRFSTSFFILYAATTTGDGKLQNRIAQLCVVGIDN